MLNHKLIILRLTPTRPVPSPPGGRSFHFPPENLIQVAPQVWNSAASWVKNRRRQVSGGRTCPPAMLVSLLWPLSLSNGLVSASLVALVAPDAREEA